uniref:Uncharacterized protein n=1 Tax=Tanacetum cinerariifolium TaxID=118510 RepID=A0A699IS16_TANCI|nr:hypothetical protein [Tanacetum cinerariifolium]GFA42021.1 hypothetical protein [Tanacetum cinerariifolium]
MSSYTVTYTSVYIDSEPWRFQGVYDDEPEAPDAAPQSPGQAPPSLDYVPGPEYPPSLDYIPDPGESEQAPLYPHYVPEPEYPKFLRRDADDESSDDDDDDDDKDDEQEASKDDDEEDEEHLAPADSPDVPAINLSPQLRIQRHLRPITATQALIDTVAAALPSSLTPSPLSSPLPHPTYVEASLGYRSVRIWLRAASPPTHHPSKIPSPHLLVPFTSHRDDILEADLPPQKRLCLTAPTPRFEVGESSSAIARQAKHPMSREVGYEITDTWDELVDTI